MREPNFRSINIDEIVEHDAKYPPRRLELDFYQPHEIELLYYFRNVSPNFTIDYQYSADITKRSVLCDVQGFLASGGVFSPETG